MNSDKAIIKEVKIVIPTYPECRPESLPMFAENRNHQLTSGRPYPNAVVLETQRQEIIEKEYTAVVLENEYLEVTVLPEIGGRIFSAKDKRTGYDFFYKQHVIKPALIGCLGSWISGGVEFNWPFHHRPSTFMPVDYVLEREEDGSVTVWLSEHDPMERMKGMVGVTLRPGRAVLETRMKVANRTPLPHSFLWWENAAVPVHPDYRLFFPPDVTYAHYHYKRSVTPFPFAQGVFNGISLKDHPDLRVHGQSRYATSYFSAPSKYSFFGGYDPQVDCGVVHVADNHVSVGKKMFTWAYNQLAGAWERALTDTDGPYAELMASSYSDNQPDFAWLLPYEEKCFAQNWYPISKIGVPRFANMNGALRFEEGDVLVYTTSDVPNGHITVFKDGRKLVDQTTDFSAGVTRRFETGEEGPFKVCMENDRGELLLSFADFIPDATNIADTKEEIPALSDMKSADELYWAGIHIDQYRDPVTYPDVYWREALCRDPGHVPSLAAMGEFLLKGNAPKEALSYLERALENQNRFNKHPRSGEVYYLYGLALRRTGCEDEAYDAFQNAAWSGMTVGSAMTQIAAIDGLRRDYSEMKEHAGIALKYGTGNPVASAYQALAMWKLGEKEGAVLRLKRLLERDPMNHLMRFALCVMQGDVGGFYEKLHSDPSSTCLDIAYDLYNAGFAKEGNLLLQTLGEVREEVLPMVYYVLLANGGDESLLQSASRVPVGRAFPFRHEDMCALETVTSRYPGHGRAHYLLGCLYYGSRQYEKAERCFLAALSADENDFASCRNLAALYYSHLNKRQEVLPLLYKALKLAPGEKQLVYELSYVMTKLGVDEREHIRFLQDKSFALNRDDVVLELVKAFNRAGDYEKALETLLQHRFVACEGGEHAIADQYMMACFALGRQFADQGDWEKAARWFEKGYILPDDLGTGLWHEAKTVPHKYQLALCRLEQGRDAEAKALFQYIVSLDVDYFSDSYLPELPVYQALALRRLGKTPDADFVISRFSHKVDRLARADDTGFYGITAFFLSYVDTPAEARMAHVHYLNGMIQLYKGNAQEAHALFEKSIQLDQDTVFPRLLREVETL